MARYRLEIKHSAAHEIEGLPTKKVRRLIVEPIGKLAADPRPSGCEKVAGIDCYRVRQGPYRIVYEVDDATRIVRVVKVGHRREVYRR